MTQEVLLRMLRYELDLLPDGPVASISFGNRLVGVECHRMGLAAWVPQARPVPFRRLRPTFLPKSAKTLSLLMLTEDPQKFVIGMAAMNALLPDPPRDRIKDGSIRDLLADYGMGRRVVVIGRDPFPDRDDEEFMSYQSFWRLPGRSKPDSHAWGRAVRDAEVLAMAASTIADGSMLELLRLAPSDAVKILYGPGTPFSPYLFEAGLDLLAGFVVTDPEKVREGIRSGIMPERMAGASSIICVPR